MFDKHEIKENINKLIDEYSNSTQLINTNVNIDFHYVKMSCSLSSYIIYNYIDEYISDTYNQPVYNKKDFSDYLEIKKICKLHNIILEPTDYYINFIDNYAIKSSIIPFILTRHSYVVSQSEIDNITDDDSFLITHLFLENKFYLTYYDNVKSIQSINEEKQQQNIKELHLKNFFNNLISIIASQKEKLKEIKGMNEKEFINLFFKSPFIFPVAKYTDHNILKKLNFESIMVSKKIFGIKNKLYQKTQWFNQMMSQCNPNDWIKLGTTFKKFSPFKFFGYKLEDATGNNFPSKYNKNIKRRHPNKAKDMLAELAIEKEFTYISMSLKNKEINREELMDWYEFIIKGKLPKIFELTVKTFSLNEIELKNDKLIKIMNEKINNDDLTWNKLYLKTLLEQDLLSSNSSKRKIKI